MSQAYLPLASVIVVMQAMVFQCIGGDFDI